MSRLLSPGRRLQLRLALGLCLILGPYAVLAAGITAAIRAVSHLFAGLGLSAANSLLAVPWLVWIGVLTPLLIAGTYSLSRRWLDPREFLDEDLASRDPDLEARVTRLAKQADVPAPDVVLAEASVPNSFLVGRSSNAVLVVTTGLRDALADDELEAVLAHELAHASNRDSTLMTVICGVFVLNNVLFQLLLLALPTFGAKPINVEAGVLATYGLAAAGISFLAFGESFSVLVFVALVLSLWLCTLAVALFQFTMGAVTAPLTRDRELAADRGAVELIGTAAPLASALETLSDRSPTDVDARARNHGVLAVSFLPYATDLVSRPERHLSVRLLDQVWLIGCIHESTLFAPVADVLEWGAQSSASAAGAAVDHPSLERRIEQLRATAANSR
ncbi:M48 family metalloprotease [Natronolimnobius sp. AArcel1]|uniref:M48 family metalloprotease n=1 Tax=Natronolimnobius sp. AArcel1 TaxID=1679093 RepID=UPI0013EA28B0|nr:M48 family metalloprotease [Natronolimnobius sp. AArcel1]NGM68270.1 M48 family metalloprotease [Natronolimnobius sp. AArcel1]